MNGYLAEDEQGGNGVVNTAIECTQNVSRLISIHLLTVSFDMDVIHVFASTTGYPVVILVLEGGRQGYQERKTSHIGDGNAIF